MLIALIFVVEAFSKLIHILDKNPVNLHPGVALDYNCTCLPPSYGVTADNETDYETESPFGKRLICYLPCFYDLLHLWVQTG